MNKQYTKQQLKQMNSEFIRLRNEAEISSIVKNITQNVLLTAESSLIYSYQWFPRNNKPLPSIYLLEEICRRLRQIFIDSDIRTSDNSIFVNWY